MQLIFDFIQNLTKDRKIIFNFFERMMGDNKRFFEAEEERYAITRINGYLLSLTKYNCISCARNICKFLNYKSNAIRECACSALAFVVNYIAVCICTENDPEKIKEFSLGLESIIEILQSGNFNKDVLEKVKAIIEQIKSIIYKKELPLDNNNLDFFVSQN